MKTDSDAMNYPEASALDYPLIKLKSVCAERDRLKAANAEMLEALKNLLAWANIQDTHSSQAVELRNAARAAIKNSEAL